MSDNLDMWPGADWLDATYIQGMVNRMLANAAEKDTGKGVSWPEGGRPRASAAEYAKKVVRHLTRYLILADNGMGSMRAVDLINRAAFNAATSLHKDEPEPPNDHLVAVGCNAMFLHRIDRLEGEKPKPEPLRKTKQLACPKCGDSPIAKTGPLDYRCANPDCNARLRQDAETVRMKKLLTLAEAAELLRADPVRLLRAARRGRVAGAVRLPTGETRFDLATLERWLSDNIAAGETLGELGGRADV